MTMDVKISCRRCGRQAEASTFTIDPIYKMAVCPSCVKERKASAFQKPAQSAPKPAPVAEKPRPAGWDEEDAELERLSKQRPQSTQAIRIDDERVKYACTKCQYKFTYNTLTKTPANCPYCGRAVDRHTL